MKLNKISAGLGVTLLAAVGAFATTLKSAPTPYYYVSSGGTSCLQYSPNFTCTVGGNTCKIPANGPIPGAQLYLQPSTPGSDLPCTVILQRQSGF